MLIDPRGRPLRLLPDARRKLSIRREMRTGLAFLIGNLGASIDDKPEPPYRLFPATDEDREAEAALAP